MHEAPWMPERQPPQPPAFSVTTHCGVVNVVGEVDVLTAPALKVCLAPLVAAGGHVRVNARRVTFFGASGLNATTLRARGRVVVLNPARSVVRLIDLFSMRSLFDVVSAPPQPLHELDAACISVRQRRQPKRSSTMICCNDSFRGG